MKGEICMVFLAPLGPVLVGAVEAAFASEAACMFAGGAATAAALLMSRHRD